MTQTIAPRMPLTETLSVSTCMPVHLRHVLISLAYVWNLSCVSTLSEIKNCELLLFTFCLVAAAAAVGTLLDLKLVGPSSYRSEVQHMF